MTNQRKSERVGLDVKVDLNDAGQYHRVRSRDLSSGGLFIEMAHPSKVGTELGLLLRLQPNHIIHVRAVVCWVQKGLQHRKTSSGMGVAFTQVDERDLAELSAVIGDLKRQSAETPAANQNAEGPPDCHAKA